MESMPITADGVSSSVVKIFSAISLVLLLIFSYPSTTDSYYYESQALLELSAVLHSLQAKQLTFAWI